MKDRKLAFSPLLIGYLRQGLNELSKDKDDLGVIQQVKNNKVYRAILVEENYFNQ